MKTLCTTIRRPAGIIINPRANITDQLPTIRDPGHLISTVAEKRLLMTAYTALQHTRIPSSASIKEGALQQPAAQRVYPPDHHPTRQSAWDPQDTLHSPRCSIPVNFSGYLRIFKITVIYDSLYVLGTLQVHQVLPLDRSDRNPSVYGSSDWPILVDCLIFQD